MENYVAGQLAALGTAVALGAAGGLVYDLLRVLRRRRPGLTHAADAVFGLVCLLGALWALTRVGGGEPQLYLLLGAGAGMLLYLLAGVRIQVGDDVRDGSVRSRIDRLAAVARILSN